MSGRRLGRVGLALVALAPSLAQAERGAVDLAVHAVPAPTTASLEMRPRLAQAPAAAADDAADPGATPSRTSAALTDYHPLPADGRDLEERVIARLSAGVALDSATLSGELMRTGFDPGAVTAPDGTGFRDRRQYLMGDAVVGSRGILLPSLNTYFLSRFRFDPEGESRFAAMNDLYDRRGGSDLVIRAGYAEIDGLGDGVLAGVSLRGGRLFRGATGAYLTNFDGGAAGFRSPNVSLDGFVGRRVSLYPVDDPGLVGGAGLAIRGPRILGQQIELEADYTFFGGVDDPDGTAVSRHAVAAQARIHLGQGRLYLRGRVIDQGDGFGLGRLGARLRQPVGRKLLVVADVEERFAGELAYDLQASEATDVVTPSQLPALGLEPPLDSTLVGGRVDVTLSRTLEAFGFGRINKVHDDGVSHYQNGWQELGGALAATAGRLTGSGQVKVRRYTLDADANQAGDSFFDTSGSGVSQFAEVAGEARYRLADKKGSAAVGAYYRAYSLRSPYVEVDDDGRGGARLEADYWATRLVRILFAGEIAEPSPILARELSALTSVRLLLEARF